MWTLNQGTFYEYYKATLKKTIKNVVRNTQETYILMSGVSASDLYYLYENTGTASSPVYKRTKDTSVVSGKSYYIRDSKTYGDDGTTLVEERTNNAVPTETLEETYSFNFAYTTDNETTKGLDVLNTWASHSNIIIKTSSDLDFVETDKVIIDGHTYSIISEGIYRELTDRTNNPLGKPKYITYIGLHE